MMSREVLMGGKVSAVLFAKDLTRMTTFYRDVLSARTGCSAADYATLHCGANFSLVIHQTPVQYAADIRIDTPLHRREQAALKLCFPVDSIVRARKVAAELGGMLDAGPPTWVIEQQKICLGHDPEGNVFQVNEY